MPPSVAGQTPRVGRGMIHTAVIHDFSKFKANCKSRFVVPETSGRAQVLARVRNRNSNINPATEEVTDDA